MKGTKSAMKRRRPAPERKVTRSRAGRIVNLEKTSQYVKHYSFHLMDPVWGHVTITMSGHAPFGAQVMLNGHEYVAAATTRAGVGYRKEGNLIGTPTYDLTKGKGKGKGKGKVHFGRLTLKAYTKGNMCCASRPSATTPSTCIVDACSNAGPT